MNSHCDGVAHFGLVLLRLLLLLQVLLQLSLAPLHLLQLGALERSLADLALQLLAQSFAVLQNDQPCDVTVINYVFCMSKMGPRRVFATFVCVLPSELLLRTTNTEDARGPANTNQSLWLNYWN